MYNSSLSDIIRTNEKKYLCKNCSKYDSSRWQWWPTSGIEQSSSATENEDISKPGTSATTKRSSLTQALNEMTEETEPLSAISSANEEVGYIGNVDWKVDDVKVDDVKVDDVKVEHDVELSEGETFEQPQSKKQKMKMNKKMNKKKRPI